MDNVKLSPVLWFWLPVAVMAIQAIVELSMPEYFIRWYISEQGPVELGQSLLTFIGFIVAITILRLLDYKTQKWLMAWVGVAAAACFYITLEELSWGQQILHWQTPAEWARINDQNETNLHNTSSWFDQKPRLVLEIGVLIGGIVIPLLRHFKSGLLPSRFAMIYPTDHVVVTALFAFVVKMIDTVDKNLDSIYIFERTSEVGETYLFLFVLIYLLGLRRRIMQNKR